MNRRDLITGLISLVAAPAIVRAGSLMPVKVINAAHVDFVYYDLGTNILLLSREEQRLWLNKVIAQAAAGVTWTSVPVQRAF